MAKSSTSQFARDLAVLKLVEPETPLPACPVASSPPEKESVLMAISYGLDFGWGVSIGNVRSVGKKTVRAKAPWPLDDDELPWMETDWMMFHRGPPPPCRALFGCKEKVTGSVSQITGSPWFNLYGELVGIASWELIDAPGLALRYAAPISSIWPVVDYAETKGIRDPVVMDTWIHSEVIGGDQ